MNFTRILITGAKGFIGKNLIETLKTIKDSRNNSFEISKDIEIYEYDLDNDDAELSQFTKECDFVIHLAGVNRPQHASEFYEANKGFTQKLCTHLKEAENDCPIIISSSIQVGRDNDYAKSKKEGEDFLLEFGKENGNKIYIYRFANLFGKWCRPNYNSVTATWCSNIAKDIDIQIDDPNANISLCYIDDVVEEIINCLGGKPYFDSIKGYYSIKSIYNITLGELAQRIKSFKDSRRNLHIPNQSDELTRKLYATYLTYLPKRGFSYPLKMNIDSRGSFTEFIRTEEHGQISVNISKPGITKGNHWHNTKNEKFLVVAGEGLLQFRQLGTHEIFEYHVSDKVLEVIDIPPGYTHNIINIGKDDMVTIMWSNESFNHLKPDTYFEKVDNIF